MANWLNLEGKVVAVTGGASGIGKHIASTARWWQQEQIR